MFLIAKGNLTSANLVTQISTPLFQTLLTQAAIRRFSKNYAVTNLLHSNFSAKLCITPA